MKFIHIADLHLDMPQIRLRGNKELSRKRKLEQKLALKKVVDYIKDNKVELFFISGDLFEQKYVEDDTINYIIGLFEEIKDTTIFISPGNHDPLTKNSAYNLFEFPDNVIIFGKELGKHLIGNVCIYGNGFENYEIDNLDYKNISLDSKYINILVTHGTLNGNSKKYNDIKEKDIERFDYVALGHIHAPKIDNTNIIYSGSLTSCGFDEPGVHGMCIGEIKETENVSSVTDRKSLIDFQFVQVDETQYETKTIDITECTSIVEAIDKLDLKNNFYKIELTGVRNIDVNKLIEELYISNEKVCNVIDNTRYEYDLEKIAKQDTLKGLFVKNMLEEIKNNPEKEKIVMQAIEYVLH